MTEINTVLWIIATFFLISCGLLYTFKLNFVQLNFKKMFSGLKGKSDEDGISPFKTLTLALAARIGVGSLSGIALAIYKGGIGTIFWLCLSSFITLPNSFVESSLAVIYHDKYRKHYEGGPAFYIKNGLNNKWLANLYAIIITVCYLSLFLAIQSNTISKSLNTYWNVSNILSGIVIAIVSFIIISKGLKRISSFVSVLVPIMGILYMMVSLYVVIKNINMIPNIIGNIFNEALNFKSFSWGMISSILIGVQRGIFSNEAGIGTGAIASGTSSEKDPFKQGYIQMLGVYFTSFIICLSTAIIIMTSNINLNDFVNPNGIEITSSALSVHLGDFGVIILLLSIISFAFSTIISGYYYGECNLKFINRKFNLKFLSIIVSIMLLIGSVISPTKLWNVIDIGVAILAIINCYALFKLKDVFIEKYRGNK